MTIRIQVELEGNHMNLLVTNSINFKMFRDLQQSLIALELG
nr:hypothetical protein [uncultured Blautia sp.]